MKNTTQFSTFLIFCALCSFFFPSNAQQQNAENHTQRKKNILDIDSRLDKKISNSRKESTFLGIYQLIDQFTRVKIEREQGAKEYDDRAITVGFESVPARAVMDALAASLLARWERIPNKGYRLLVSTAELDLVYRDNTHYEKDRNKHSARFIQGIESLPTDTQARLMSGEYSRISNLPEPMQQSLLGIMETWATQTAETGRPSKTLPLLEIPQGEIEIHSRNATGFKKLFLRVRTASSGDFGFSITNYHAKKEERLNAKTKLGEPSPIYVPDKLEITHKEAKELPVLKQLITLKLSNATLPETLRTLHAKYKIPFLCDIDKTDPLRKDIDVVDLPLGDFLDELTKTYEGSEWEWRPYQFLVMRNDKNISTAVNVQRMMEAKPLNAKPPKK